MKKERGSKEFERFLTILGNKIRLKGWDKYRGGLDVKGKKKKKWNWEMVKRMRAGSAVNDPPGVSLSLESRSIPFQFFFSISFFGGGNTIDRLPIRRHCVKPLLAIAWKCR